VWENPRLIGVQWGLQARLDAEVNSG
jgi:hypothetical protein